MKRLGCLVKGFTGIIVGTSLLPSLGSGMSGGVGRVANLGQTFASVGLVGFAARGSRCLWKKK